MAADGYDQKLDQRVAKHEFLRDRNNATTCRSLARQHDADWRRTELRQKRQTEFWKRRQIEPTGVPSAIEEDVQKPHKVVLREKTRKADPLDRRSLVMAEDLGITWPDVTSIEKADINISILLAYLRRGYLKRLECDLPVVCPVLLSLGPMVEANAQQTREGTGKGRSEQISTWPPRTQSTLPAGEDQRNVADR